MSEFSAATARLFETFRVRAAVLHVDADPAGNTTTYGADPTDMGTLGVFLGRKVEEHELRFMCGPGSETYYYLTAELVDEFRQLLQDLERVET